MSYAVALASNASSFSLVDSILHATYSGIERFRIQTHLRLVEHTLRIRNVEALPKTFQQRRTRHLDRLHEYWQRGIFPQNTYVPNVWIPCFKDAKGISCAVGYLMEQDGYRTLVQQTADTNMHVRVNDLKQGGVFDWIKQSGLTQREAALIQPSYGPCGMMGDRCPPVTRFFLMHPQVVGIGVLLYFIISEVMLYGIARICASSFSKAICIWLLITIGNLAVAFIALERLNSIFLGL